MDERDERERTSGDASKRLQTASKLELHHCSRKSVAETYLLATRCPVYRRHDSHSGSRTELENLSGDAKGKGPSSEPARPKVPMRRAGADCPVIARKRGNAVERRGQVTDVGSEPTGNRRSSNSRRKAAAFVRWHEPDDARVSSPDVCPGKASMFSRRQSCRGKSQSPVVRIAKGMERSSRQGRSLAGCKSPHRQLPVFGRLAYPMRGEATNRVLLGRKSPGCPA